MRLVLQPNVANKTTTNLIYHHLLLLTFYFILPKHKIKLDCCCCLLHVNVCSANAQPKSLVSSGQKHPSVSLQNDKPVKRDPSASVQRHVTTEAFIYKPAIHGQVVVDEDRQQLHQDFLNVVFSTDMFDQQSAIHKTEICLKTGDNEV